MEPSNTVVETQLATQLEQIALKRISQDKLILPTLPAVALKVMELIRKPDFTFQKAAQIIEADPILAVRLLKIANSAANSTRQPATNIQSALSVLGAQKLRSALVEASTRPLFESKDARIAEATRKTWEHSQAVASISRDLAVMLAVGDAEDCYLAGLLHDVGKPVLAALLLEAENALAARSVRGWVGSSVWVAVLQRSHRKVGVSLAEGWKMPTAVVKAIAECGDYDSTDRLSPANVVRFCNALVKQAGIYIGDLDTADNDALVMIGRSLLGVEDDAHDRLQAKLRERRAAAA